MPLGDVQAEGSCTLLTSRGVIVTRLVQKGFERGDDEDTNMSFALPATRVVILLCRHTEIVVSRMDCLDGL